LCELSVTGGKGVRQVLSEITGCRSRQRYGEYARRQYSEWNSSEG